MKDFHGYYSHLLPVVFGSTPGFFFAFSPLSTTLSLFPVTLVDKLLTFGSITLKKWKTNSNDGS
ncbi:hypothetical protein A3750_10990 [Oleiphilus sp. HI0079]|nr:hypothetical protein A3750_10990 [Oleiphilus sp. HI0079]